MNRFKGVAYWEIDSVSKDWTHRAREVLLPLEESGLAAIRAEESSLSITIDDDKLDVTFTAQRSGERSGQGVIRQCQVASLFLVCLLALRKALKDIKVVGDDMKPIASIPKQNNPVFSEDWLRVEEYARTLKLIANAGLLNRILKMF